MDSRNLMETARMMIQRYGMRASAVARERTTEMQAKGDTAEFAKWQQIDALIAELKRTERRAERNHTREA